jgi:hypothetical protein
LPSSISPPREPALEHEHRSRRKYVDSKEHVEELLKQKEEQYEY